AGLEDETGVAIAVENMFPVRRKLGRGRSVAVTAFRPSIDPTDVGHRNYTLDLSHASAAHMDTMELAKRMGDGLTHVHLADGSGLPKDEHLVPGRGTQPCAELLESLAPSGFTGQVVLEVNTRKAKTDADRRDLLAESLLFARLHV
ncbi:MAG: sugar phosphate isomerase/epimerase, partial [Saccharothrix sp.]|nr:sugar phosphate isomerase/epimerase [Saccharothrix sp.]